MYSRFLYRARELIHGSSNIRGFGVASLYRYYWGDFKKYRGETISIVQNQIGQQFGPYREFSVVVDQSHCSEFVHEVRDAGPGRAHHFGQGLVTQYGDSGIRRDIMCP